jgi:hypothetical protein
MLTDSRIIEAYVTSARPIMLEWMTLNSCIGSARVTVDFLQRCGIEARVQPCKFVVEWTDKKLAYASGLSEAERANAIGQRQAYSDGWNGHLLVIAARRWIIDPSFDQALVALGIEPDSTMLYLESDAPAMRGEGDLALELQAIMNTGEALKIRYIPLFDDSYRDTEAWKDEGLPFLVSEIATRTLNSLAQGARLRTAGGKS